MSRPGSAGSNPRPTSAGSDLSLDSELPVLFPSIFGLQRERSIVGDPWQVDNQAIRQLSGAAKRGNLPRLTSAHSRLPAGDGKRSNSTMGTQQSQPTPARLESMPRSPKVREMHIHMPNDFPVLPSISPDRAISPDGYLDIQKSGFDHAHGTGSVGNNEAPVLPRDSTFGSNLSLNSHGSTIHSSPDLTSTGSERFDTTSGGSFGPTLRVVSPQNQIPGPLDAGSHPDSQGRSSSPKGGGSGSRSSSPHPPMRPRTRSASRRRHQEQERLAKQRLEQVALVLQGCCHGNLPDAPSSQVRLYLSSTGKDMVAEIQHLRADVFPKLRGFCDDLDLDLVLVDLHSNSTEDDKETYLHRLQLQEITNCQHSIGPLFALLLGNHPGARLLPMTISQEDFKLLQAVMERDSPEDARLLGLYYKKDENCAPPVYVLLSSGEANGITGEKDTSWRVTKERLWTLIASAAEMGHAQGMMTDDRFQHFNMSVLEYEVHHGMLKNKSTRRCSLAYLRDLEGLLDDLDNPEAVNYIDIEVRGKNKIPNSDSTNLIHNIKGMVIPEAIGENNIHTYAPWWQVNGLEPEHCQHNANYIKLLERHFMSDVKRIINHCVKQRNSDWAIVDRRLLLLYEEVVQHTDYASDTSKDYIDFNGNLSKAKTMLMSKEGAPVCVIGSEGSGKSALIAKLSCDIKALVDKDCVCVTRFIKVMIHRQSLRSVLLSVCHQICRAYKLSSPSNPENEHLYSLAVYFQDLLTTVSDLIGNGAQQKTLCILLDSVDVLPEDQENKLWWLPRKCPTGITIAVSIARESVQESTKDRYSCIALTSLTKSQGVEFTNTLLQKQGHSLSQPQAELLSKAIGDATELSALQGTLVARNASTWRSYHTTEDLSPTCVIKDMFTKQILEAERMFGAGLVAHVCGYITAACDGISETELVNVLASHEQLRKEYHLTLNVQSAVLIRLRESIDMFLCRTVYRGQTYIAWSHDCIRKLVESHYSSNSLPVFHTVMADLHMNQIQLCADRKGTSRQDTADVNKTFTKPSNLNRCFSVLPYHLKHSGKDLAKSKENVYCNLHCIALRLWISSVYDLIEDLEQLKVKDKDLSEMCNLLSRGKNIFSSELDETFEMVLVRFAAFINGSVTEDSTDSPHLSRLLQHSKSITQNQSPVSHLSPVFPYCESHNVHYTHMLTASDVTLHSVSEKVLVVTRDTSTGGVSILDLESMMPIRQDGLFSPDSKGEDDAQRLVVSQDGSHVVIYEGNMVTLQHLISGTIVHQLTLDDDGEVPSLKQILLSADCATIAMVTHEDTLVTLDISIGDVRRRYPMPECDGKEQHVNKTGSANPKTEQTAVETDRTSSVASTSKIELCTEESVIQDRSRIADIQFSPDFSMLTMIEESTGWSVVVWDCQQWTTLSRINLGSEACTNTYFSPDSSLFVIGVTPLAYKIINTKSNNIHHTLQSDRQDVTQHKQKPCIPCFSKDSRLLMASTGHNTVAILCTETGKQKQTLRTELCTALQFNPDSTLAFVGDLDGKVTIWDVISGSCVLSIDCGGQIQNMYNHIRAGDSVLYTVTSDGCLDAWCLTHELEKVRSERLNVLSSSGVQGLRHLNLHEADIDDSTYQIDIDQIGSYSNDNQEVFTQHEEMLKPQSSSADIKTGVFHDVQLSPDGRFVITAHRQEGVQIWDVTTGRHVTTIECADVWRILIANEGTTLVCTTYTKQLMLYSLERDRWQLVDRLRNLSHIAMDCTCVSADSRTLIVLRQCDIPPDDIDIYAIDLVTCHIMAHFVMKVDVEPSRIPKMSVSLSQDHAHLVTCLTRGSGPFCNLVVCDLYKEITITLPSWARSSPSPLVSARSKAVTPLGIHVEDFGGDSSQTNFKASTPRVSQVPSGNSSLLFVPNEATERVEHVYPTQPALHNTTEVEVSDHMYEGVVINVIEDENIGSFNGADNLPPRTGLLGAGLFAEVRGDHSDAEAMLRHTNTLRTNSDPHQADQELVLQADKVKEGLNHQHSVQEGSGAPPGGIEGHSAHKDTVGVIRTDSTTDETGESDSKPEGQVRRYSEDTTQDIRALQEALTKVLESTDSTESDPVVPSDESTMDNVVEAPLGGRLGSPTGDRQNAVSDRPPPEGVLTVIMESGEDEEQTIKNTGTENGTAMVLDNAEQTGREGTPVADNGDTETTNTKNKDKGNVDVVGQDSASLEEADVVEEKPPVVGQDSASLEEADVVGELVELNTGVNDNFEEDPLYKSSFSDVDLSVSRGRFRRLKKLDSLSAITMTNPVRPSSQMSLALPFEFDEDPPQDAENPTGRRRPLGHVVRNCRLPVPEPELITVALRNAELLVGTQMGNLLVLDFASTTITQALSTEEITEEETQSIIKMEKDNLPCHEHFPKMPHKGTVTHVSRSHDFRYVVAASDDKTLTLWNMAEMTFLHRLEGHRERVLWGEISGDTTMVVSGSADRAIRLWDLNTGVAIYVLNTYSPVIQTRFSFGDLHVVARLGRPGLAKVAIFRVHRPQKDKK